MKKLLITIICITIFTLSGCAVNGKKPKIKLKGFSVGAMYLRTNINTGFGRSTQIREIVPIATLNFEF